MRRTVANINPKIIHFDAVDFSGHHSKSYKFHLMLSVLGICADRWIKQGMHVPIGKKGHKELKVVLLIRKTMKTS